MATSGTVGSVVMGILNPPGGGAVGSVQSAWVQCHDNLEAAADTSAICLKPWSSTKTTFHWVKVPAGATRVQVRGKVDAAATTIATAPVVRIIGAKGGAPDATTHNFSDTTSATNFAEFERIDSWPTGGTSNAAGITLTLNVTTAGFEDASYVYGDTYATLFDLLGCSYIGLFVTTAASVTGGASNGAYGEFSFLN